MGKGRHAPGSDSRGRVALRPQASALIAIALGFSVGVAIYFTQAERPPALAIGALCVLAGAGLVLKRLPVPLIGAAVGFCWAHLSACQVLCEPFPERLVGQDVTVVGRIASLPDQSRDRTRFILQVESLRRGDLVQDFTGRIRLSWYRNAPDLAAGERWRLRARLRPPHGFVNPGGFDYERWLFRQRVEATGYVRDGDDHRLLSAEPGPYWLDRWRQRLRERLVSALPTGIGQALVPTLVIGDRGALTPSQWEVFSRTGTSHLIAISGLHVGLIAGAVLLLVRRLWSLVPALSLRAAAPRAGAVAALAAACGYAALAGFAVSTQRALVMLAVVLLALIAGRTLRPMQTLVLALAAVLAVDPPAVLDVGFWLSFGAVAVLLYALGQRVGQPRWPARWGAAQWAVALGLLPLLVFFFGRASLAAPLVNLIAVPVFAVLLPVVLASALLSLVTGWSLPLLLAAWPLELGYTALAWVAEAPWAAASFGGRPAWVWLAAALGVLLWLAPRGVPARWLGAVLVLPLWLARPAAPGPGELRAAVLDVGQGLACVLMTANHTLVYDVGPRFRSGFNTGEAVVAPYLRQVGVERVDVLMLSHADQDHAGGMHGLLGRVPVQRLLSGEPGKLAHASVEPCERGQHWLWDGVGFEVLHPSGDGLSGNNSSCVLKVVVGGWSLLLPGDSEASVERTLVQSDGERLRSDVLVAAHHGSASSSTASFLDAVDPAWVLISAGWRNRFGFPAAEVRSRVVARGASILDTAYAGAIELWLSADGGLEKTRLYRSAADRLWRHRPSARTSR